ncbi:protein D3-like [Bacillus rossius redtenbacheri]|uniref:protein D3-like n=1 Tax=Bacillus rossius redtenbacheri TaxID=93214 RepID=UPI002FDD34FC
MYLAIVAPLWAGVLLLFCPIGVLSAGCTPYALPEDFKSACDVRNLQVISASGNTIVDNANCNELFSKSEFSTSPSVQFDGADPEKTYTLIMVDPDAPNHSEGQYWLHWIVANIKGADLRSGNIGSSHTVVTSYHPPGPPKGTGPHRYVFLLLEQAKSKVSMESPDKRPRFNLATYLSIQEGKFCRLVAGAQFRAQYEA